MIYSISHRATEQTARYKTPGNDNSIKYNAMPPNIEYRISLEWGATLTHSRRIKQDKTRSKQGRVPNLGFTKVSAALVGLSALVLQVLSGDAGDTTLQHGSNAEAGTANLREQGE